MSISYYTSFLIEEGDRENFRHVSGVFRLASPLGRRVSEEYLRCVIARGMNVTRDEVQLIHWSPLH